jgi:hypothetical protein
LFKPGQDVLEWGFFGLEGQSVSGYLYFESARFAGQESEGDKQKQYHFGHCERLEGAKQSQCWIHIRDCFVAGAPRNDSLFAKHFVLLVVKPEGALYEIRL